MITNLLLALAYGAVLLFVLMLLWSAHPALAAGWAIFVIGYSIIKGLRSSSVAQRRR